MITKRFGPEYADYPGLIAEPGKGPFLHRFGGNSWEAIDEKPLCGGPSLLMTLSLDDDRLALLKAAGLDELPLCSYLNTEAAWGRQIFEVQPKLRRVVMLQRMRSVRPMEEKYLLPTKIDELPLALRPMREDEYPTTLENWSKVRSNQHGGAAFIRVLGAPVFGDNVYSFPCACDRPMKFVASIGWEDLHTGRMLNGKAFFPGEGGLFFYFCPECLFLLVHGDGSE
jgi:hypothetical protein